MAWVYHNKPPMGWPLDLSEPINTGLVNYWYMPEGSGGQVFSLLGKNTGIFQGNTHYVPGAFGSSAIFAAGSDAIIFESNPIPTGDATMFMWIYPTQYVTSPRLATDDRFIFFISSSTSKISYTSDGSTIVTGEVVSLNEIHLVAFSRTAAGVANVYLDGVLSSAADQDSGVVAAGPDPLWLGNSDGLNRDYIGRIEAAGAYNRILTASEHALLYRFPFYGFLNPDEIPVLDQYYAVAPAGIVVLRRRIEAA